MAEIPDNRPDWLKEGEERKAKGQSSRPTDFYWNDEERKAHEAHNRTILADARAMEEAKAKQEELKTEREKIRRGLSPDAAGPRTLVGRSLGSVAPRSIQWLWAGWVPKGYITLLAGETGAGKTTVLADITARVTTGMPWPGEFNAQPGENAARPRPIRPPARVLWLGSEDGIEEMTVPRLMACGADLNNVIEIQGVTQEGQRNTFSMQDDLRAVDEWLAFAKSEGTHTGPVPPARRGGRWDTGFQEPDPWPFDGCKRREPVLDLDRNPPRVVRSVGWRICIQCSSPFWSVDTVRVRLCNSCKGVSDIQTRRA